MSDSETSDEDFRPGDKEDSEDDSECEEEEEEEEVEDAAIAVEQKRASRRGAKTEETDVKKDELESDEEDKSRTDALWKDFLSDVKPQTSNKSVIKSTTITSDSEKKDNKNAQLKTDSTEEPKKKVSSPINSLKLNEEKTANGKRESLTNLQSPIPTKVKRPLGGGGLSAVLSITQKKQKKSILDSSLEDWQSFKEDEGLQEELKEYNKGKDGYLDRQDFLKRTDYRQFEIEKNLRRTRYK